MDKIREVFQKKKLNLGTTEIFFVNGQIFQGKAHKQLAKK